MITVTLLVENTARGAGILGEHGLAWWIDTGKHRVLFDTGQGMALRRMNVRRMSPVHCTGWAVTAAIQREFPERCFRCAASTVVKFDEPLAPPLPS